MPDCPKYDQTLHAPEIPAAYIRPKMTFPNLSRRRHGDLTKKIPAADTYRSLVYITISERSYNSVSQVSHVNNRYDHGRRMTFLPEKSTKISSSVAEVLKRAPSDGAILSNVLFLIFSKNICQICQTVIYIPLSPVSQTLYSC